MERKNGIPRILKKVKKTVKQQVSEECKVNLNEVIKNNNQKLDGITITNRSECMVPNIYLNTYYQDYLQGRELGSIVNEIIHLHNQKYSNSLTVTSDILNPNTISSKVTYRLINLEMNRERLKTIPHMVICDLAKVYYIIVESDSNGTAAITITNELIKHWNYSIEDIDMIAEMNTPSLLPKTIKTMNEIIREMFQIKTEDTDIHSFQEDIEISEKFFQDMQESFSKADEIEMYVLSNINNLNGASAMIYPNVLHDFAVSHQSNLYILPSSTHEIILIPINQRLTKESLRQMVIEVNQTQVAPEEVLSNEVYYYDYKNDELSIAKE